jgi:hypothetical protein
VEETLKVGDVQDADWSHTTVLSLLGSQWSEPKRVENNFCRSLTIQSDGPGCALGHAVFHAYAFFENEDYAFQICYRCDGPARLLLKIVRNGALLQNPTELPTDTAGWIQSTIEVSNLQTESQAEARENVGVYSSNSQRNSWHQKDLRRIRHWPSEGSLTIENILLLGTDGQERAVFKAGSPLILSITIVAHRDGHFDFVPSASLYRMDGIFICNFIAEPMPLDLSKGEMKEIRLHLNPLNLGDGYYVFASSIFEKKVEEGSRYDLVDREYEFQVVGNEPFLAGGVFQHSCTWTLVD